MAVVNPASLNRTIIHETKLNDLSLSSINYIVDAIAKAVHGSIVKSRLERPGAKEVLEGWGVVTFG